MGGTGAWAVVPAKNFENAKQRLAQALTPEQRHCLFAAMLEDVLVVLSQCTDLAGVLVVTRDREARALAESVGAEVLWEAENRGQTAAVSDAAQYLVGQGVTAMLAVPGDVPLITVSEVQKLLAEHGNAPAMTIAPARDELGSNGIVCSPPEIIPLRFGDNSFVPHLQAARNAGIQPRIVKLPGFGLDIDRPDDLEVFVSTPSSTRSYEYLQQTGIPDLLSQIR